MTRRLIPLLIVGALFAGACASDDPLLADDVTTPDGDDATSDDGDGPALIDIDTDAGERYSNRVEGLPRLALQNVVTGLRGPVEMRQAPGSDRMYILMVRAGTILILEDGEILEEPFLDITERLEANGQGTERGRGERGLLSLAFHPDYQENGRFFIWYADQAGIAELAEYTVSADNPDVADPDSKVLLREFEAVTDHFGGGLQFGPEGFLWLGIGDGGRSRNAQSDELARGKLVRFDVSTPGVAVGAEGNPLIGQPEAAEEIFFSGLRNPWRWSIDHESRTIFIGEVGRNVAEELNIASMDEPGLNFGWGVLEGNQCFRADDTDPIPDCDRTPFTPPVVELFHQEDGGVCAVIGGHVYRGSALPELDGMYFYGDFCDGFVRSFVYDEGAVTDELEWFDDIGPIVSINEDHDGELYFLSTDGWIRKLVPAEA